jgi:hypothetical protein
VTRNPKTGEKPRKRHVLARPACRAGLGFIIATASLACGQPTSSDVSDSTFVRAMTALRLVAQDTSLDSAGRARKRDSVLRVYRLTPPALESVASRLAERPEHAVELLRAIDQRVARAANKPVTPSAPSGAPRPAAIPATPAKAATPAPKKPSL